MGRSVSVLLLLTIICSATKEFSCKVMNIESRGCLESDREALIDFKNSLADPENRLSSWQGSNCCQWWGIGCEDGTGTVVAVNLSNAGFRGIIPQKLGNLSSLQYLDLTSETTYLPIGNLKWLAALGSLRHLAMNFVDLSAVGSDWVGILNKLPILRELHLSYCLLPGSIAHLSPVNLTSLSILDLSFNRFNSKFPDWLINISSLVSVDIRNSGLYGRIPFGFNQLPILQVLVLAENDRLTASCSKLFSGGWKKIEVLDLASNKLHGKLPSSMGNMTFLMDFNLRANNVDGGIPRSIGKLCNLKSLDVSYNSLGGSLPDFLDENDKCISENPLLTLGTLRLAGNRLVGKLPEWLGHLKNLVELNLGNNMLQGLIPTSLGTLKHLTEMLLGQNELNGTLPESFGQLSELSILDVSSNHLMGIVSEVHFSKLSKLTNLFMSSNSFILNVGSNWVPPFQLQRLEMGSFHIGPSFPAWLVTQKEVMYLDFSNASISGFIPSWFWDMSSNLSLLNVSLNQLQGQLPNPLNVAASSIIDLSSNLFDGHIPLPIEDIILLDLSNNQFSGPIPPNIGNIMQNVYFLSLSNNKITGEIPVSIGQMHYTDVIDLSKNGLTGSIPPNIGNCSSLKALDIGNNNLRGVIPRSLSQLNVLQSLHLNDNMLSGELLSSLLNLSSLETLDLGNNNLTGRIHPWFGEGFPHLRILNLRSNAFFGELPGELSNLTSLHILDVGNNDLTGTIPLSFGDLKAMAHRQNISHYLFYGSLQGGSYEESFIVNTKGQLQIYTKILSLVTCIDLSENNLRGVLPEQLTKLRGLVVLNLSRNHISGHIPESISQLRELSSLDLSNNKLSGAIPPSISSLTFLAYLNFSNNNFSGKIPYTGQMTTFGESSFVGNPILCGPPLIIECQGDDDPTKEETFEDKSDNIFIDKWFYLSIGFGFAAGLLVPYFVLAMKRTWANNYFDFVDKIILRSPWGRNKAT